MRHAGRSKTRDRGCCALVLPETPIGHRLPRSPAISRPTSVEAPAHRVVAAILAGRVVHREDHQLGRAITIEIGDGDASPLVLPEVPVRDRHPTSPGGHRAVGVQRATAVVPLVATVRRIHHEYDEVQHAVAVYVADRDVGGSVEPGEPVRHREPRRPSRDLAGSVEVPADPVRAGVRTVRHGVHPKDDKVRLTVPTDIRHGHPGAFVEPRFPAGNSRPIAPQADSQIVVSPKTDPEIGRILLGQVIDAEDDQVSEPVGIEVRHRDPGAGVLEGKPVRDGGEIGVHPRGRSGDGFGAGVCMRSPWAKPEHRLATLRTPTPRPADRHEQHCTFAVQNQDTELEH